MLIAALRTTVVLALLFAVVDVVFVLLGLGALNASTGLATTGGVVGITAAALAWYWSAGGVIASTFGKPVLPNPPLFRR
ncbi:MAG TPA: GPR1/FUN34/YaaH family transporter [Microlunatus sp.]|nr:GPR1/FUN34/YaaH family transporter [Microlunatus sp.]